MGHQKKNSRRNRASNSARPASASQEAAGARGNNKHGCFVFTVCSLAAVTVVTRVTTYLSVHMTKCNSTKILCLKEINLPGA